MAETEMMEVGDLIDKVLSNVMDYIENDGKLMDTLREGFEVGFYDEETGTVTLLNMEGGELEAHIVEGGHFIKVPENV